MNKTQWLKSDRPHDMIDAVCSRAGAARTKSGRRKLRLFACACLRRVWGWHKGRRAIIERAEEAADGNAPEFKGGPTQEDWVRALFGPPRRAAEAASFEAWNERCEDGGDEDIADAAQDEEQSGLVRDIFGNPPFNRVRLVSQWLAPATTRIAEATYRLRVSDSEGSWARSRRRQSRWRLDHMRLAVLADSLEEAGCQDTDVLNHLRTPGVHVRGCWAVDLVLGKGLRAAWIDGKRN